MPGVRLNLGLSGLSLTAGPRGASVNIGPRGVFRNLGLPGTGISFRERMDAPADSRSPVSASGVSIESLKLDLDDDGRLVITDRGGYPLSPALERRVRREQADRLRGWLVERCSAIDAGFGAIERVHLDTPAPDSRSHFVPEPFREPEPQPPGALELGFWDKLFRGRRREKERAHQDEQRSFERLHTEWRARREAQVRAQEEERKRVEVRMLTEPDVMEDELERAWGALRWPRETHVDFALEENGTRLVLDVDLPEIEDLPVLDAEVAARGLKLNIRERSAIQLRRAYAAHVHGVAFRFIGVAFSELPALREVICSGYSQRPDPATSRVRDEYLFSVRVGRDQWSAIDFSELEGLDVSAALGRFELIEDLTGRARFSAIEPLARVRPAGEPHQGDGVGRTSEAEASGGK